MKVYVATDQKGGVTKTTTTQQNGMAAHLSGKRVIWPDMDWQGNLTSACGYASEALEHTIYTYMIGKSTLQETLLPTYYDPVSGIFFDPKDTVFMQEVLGLNSLEDARRGPDLLPHNTALSKEAEKELESNGFWGGLLRNLLEELSDSYDEAHVDTNPAIIHKLTKMCFYAATDIIIPVVPESWPTQGMIVLAQQLMEARKYNPQLNLAGILFARVRYASHKKLMVEIRESLVPQINEMFEEARRSSVAMRRQLQGFELSCFDNAITEGAEFSTLTNMRAHLHVANRGLSSHSIEYWQHYIELLQRTDGAGLDEAYDYYQGLVERYNAWLQQEAQRKQARAE